MASESPPNMEHRWGERIRSDLAVSLQAADDRPVQGRVMDLSVSGAYIQTAARPPLNTPVRVSFQARWRGGQFEPSAPFGAHVIRHADWGIGIEWVEFSLQDLLAVTHPHRSGSGAPEGLPEDRSLVYQRGQYWS